MAETKHPGPGGASGYEQSDLSPKAIAIFGIALAATVTVCVILAVWVFDFFANYEAKRDTPPSPLARREAPAEPLLQVSAPQERQETRDLEEKTLTSYEWVNKQAGIVRIPIGRAMELLAERGLPASPKESDTHGETVGTRRTGQPSQPAKGKPR